MYCYHAYGLNIHSEIELMGMAPGGGPPDLSIEWGTLMSRDVAPIDTSELQVASGLVPPAFLFSCINGRRLVINRSDELDEETARSHVMGVALAAILRQRGLLVLHASCVVKDGIAIGFLGPSGWGKSTLANYFYDHGYDVFCDDVMAIRVDAPPSDIIVYRGASHIRLRPDAGQWLHEDFDALPRILPGSEKRLHYASNTTGVDTARLSRLYILDTATTSSTTIEPVSVQHALMGIFSNTHAINLLQGKEDNRRHFSQCSRVAREIPVRRLRRVYGLDQLSTILELIESENEPVLS